MKTCPYYKAALIQGLAAQGIKAPQLTGYYFTELQIEQMDLHKILSCDEEACAKYPVCAGAK